MSTSDKRIGGEALVIGMPSSGKSTYLWALSAYINRHHDKLEGEGAWQIDHSTGALDGFARDFKERSDAGKGTQTIGFLDVPLFRAYRSGLSWVPGGVFSMLVRSPDVPGEWIRMLADGVYSPKEEWNGESKKHFKEFQGLLDRASALIVLVECGSDAAWAKTMEFQLEQFVRLLKPREGMASRFRAVTIVLSQVDRAIAEQASIRRIRIPRDKSYIAQWFPQVGENGQVVNLDLKNRLEDKTWEDDLAQHALAMDFLRSQAPVAANLVAGLAANPSFRVLVAFGSSLGFNGSTRPLECADPINLLRPFFFSLREISKVRGVQLVKRVLWILVTLAALAAAYRMFVSTPTSLAGTGVLP